MGCVVGIPCPDCAQAFLASPSHQQKPKLQKLQRAIRHQSGEPQCASFVFHVQDTLPKKLNANQILNSIHSHVDLQYKSVLCMCVLEMCADSGSGTQKRNIDCHRATLPLIISMRMCVLERVYTCRSVRLVPHGIPCAAIIQIIAGTSTV